MAPSIATNTDVGPRAAAGLRPPAPPHGPHDGAFRRLAAGVARRRRRRRQRPDRHRDLPAARQDPQRAQAPGGVGRRALRRLGRRVGAGRRRPARCSTPSTATRRSTGSSSTSATSPASTPTGTSTARRWSTQGKSLLRITPDPVEHRVDRRLPARGRRVTGMQTTVREPAWQAAALITGGFVAVLWVLEIVDAAIGPRPRPLRRPAPQRGRARRDRRCAPLLHFGFDHLVSNTVPVAGPRLPDPRDRHRARAARHGHHLGRRRARRLGRRPARAATTPAPRC